MRGPEEVSGSFFDCDHIIVENKGVSPYNIYKKRGIKMNKNTLLLKDANDNVLITLTK